MLYTKYDEKVNHMKMLIEFLSNEERIEGIIESNNEVRDETIIFIELVDNLY